MSATTARSPRTTAWTGQWIGCEPAPTPSLDDATGEPETGRGPSRVMFRRAFELDVIPETSWLRLSADSRFVLWVNGALVGRGPIRSQPRRWHYEEFDVARLLRPGENVVAVLVTYYARATAWWYPAVPEGGINGDACLVLEGQVGPIELASDESWHVCRSQAWAWVDHFGVPSEVLDARGLPDGWTRPNYDSTHWSGATVLRSINWGGAGLSRPPVSPFGKLLPRPIAALGGELVSPADVLEARLCAKPAWLDDHPAARVISAVSADGESLEPTIPLSARVRADQTLVLIADFGRVVVGHLELEVDAPAGTVFELGYRERVKRAGLIETTSDYQAGARYTTPGGRSTYGSIELAGLRYLYITVHSEQPVDVSITSAAVREHVYPQQGDAYFRCDDDELNRLYRAGVRTVQLNSGDAYTDCPTREQRAWVGDGVVHQMVHLTSNTDWRLAEHYVELANSPRPDGILPLSVAGDFEVTTGFTIPDWSLHWVHGVHNLYRYKGDRDRIARLLPSVERVLRWYEPHVDEFGTLTDVPEWNLVDWSSVFTSGRSAIVSGLWARGLTEFAEMSAWVGNGASAAWARGRVQAMAEYFDDFWDPARGLYVDHIIDGERMPAASQAASAVAIASGLAPRERWAHLARSMTDPAKVVVRSWVGGDGGYDILKEAEYKRGIRRVDWDVEREIVRAQPFLSYVVHDALGKAGCAERILALLRDWSSFFDDGYDTFGECWGWGTPVHGWSSTPTRDLIVHILGISPDLPGFERVRIAPRPGRVRRMAGAAPTPAGLVDVVIADEEITVSSPLPIRFEGPDGAVEDLPGGRHHLRLDRGPAQ